MNFDYFNWIVLPLLIFVSRLADVSLATLRHIFVSKGFKTLVPVLGFFEVLIWLIAIRQIINNVDNLACYLAWAGGLSAGTYLGMYIEEKLALGKQIIGINTKNETQLIYIDTPGIHRGEVKAINRHMNSAPGSAMADVDAVVFVVSAMHWTP